MHQLTAINKARRLWGDAAVVRDKGAGYAMDAAERAEALKVVERLRSEKPEGWQRRERELLSVIRRRRCIVGVQMGGLFPMLDVRGEGDTFEEAFADAVCDG